MTSKLNILVVDDRADHREMFQEILDSGGYPSEQITTAANLEEALHQLDRKFFHVAIVDNRLVEKDSKNEDGLKVLDKMHKLDEGTQAIFCSAFATLDTAGKVLEKYKGFTTTVLSKEEAARNPDHVLDLFHTAEKRAREVYRLKYGGEEEAILGRITPLLASPDDLRVWTFNATNQLGLRGGQIMFMRFVRSYFRLLMPLLKSKVQSVAKIDGKLGTITAQFWSKYLGQPILMHFGIPEKIKAEVESFKENAVPFAGQFSALHRYQETAGWAGSIFVLANASFEDFGS